MIFLNNKSLLLFVLLSATISKIFADLCYSCLSENQKCMKLFSQTNGDVIDVYIEQIGNCPSGLVCATNVSDTIIDYNDQDWVCRPYGKEGEKCYNRLPCDIGLTCNEQYVCASSNFTQVGDSCSQNSDCAGEFTTCVNQICTNVNNQCKKNDDCPYTQVCDTSSKKCTNILFEGDKCDYKSINTFCMQGLSCLSTGVCGKGSQKLGETCLLDVDCDISQGLYCPSKSSGRICESYVVPSPKNCSNGVYGNQYCDKYSICSCEDGKCYQKTPYPTEDEYINLVKCAYDNKCQLITNMGSSKSCVNKNCAKEICNYQTLNYKELTTTCNKNNYEVNKYCSGDNNGNSANSLKISTTTITTILLSLILLINLLY